MVKRKLDGKMFAAKMRFNPGRDCVEDPTHDEIVDKYKDFLAEVEMMSHSNHKNVAKMVEALRN